MIKVAEVGTTLGTTGKRDGSRTRPSLRLFFAPFNTSVLKPVLKKNQKKQKNSDQAVWVRALAKVNVLPSSWARHFTLLPISTQVLINVRDGLASTIKAGEEIILVA